MDKLVFKAQGYGCWVTNTEMGVKQFFPGHSEASCRAWFKRILDAIS